MGSEMCIRDRVGWEDHVVRRVGSVWADRRAVWERPVAPLGGRPKLHLKDQLLFNPPPSMETETVLAQQGPVQKD